MGRLSLLGAGTQGAAGGGPWVPALAGYAYFFDADRGTYTDTSLTTPATADVAVVAGWKDQSANARDLTNQAAGSSPTLKLAQANGHSCVRGSTGGNNNLSRAFTLAQPVTVLLVARLNTWNTSKAYIMDGVGGDTMDFFCSGTSPQLKLFAGSASVATNGDLPLSTWGILCAVYNGASSRLRVNAGTATTGNPGSSTTGGLTLFHSGSAFGSISGANVDIAAVIGYPSALSTSDEQTARDDLNARFAIF